MPRAIRLIEELLSQPAPGLVFGPHQYAKVGERAVAAPHRAGPAPSAESRAVVEGLIPADAGPLAELAAVCTRWDGVELCRLKDTDRGRVEAALRILPASEWEQATAPWIPGGECGDFIDRSGIYGTSTWRVVACLASEGMHLVTFFDGEFEGRPLAGRVFCVGLDGYLGFEDLVAEDFGALMEEFSADPAAFFNRLGFTWAVSDGQGKWFGDPVAGYTPDVTAHPSFVPEGNGDPIPKL